MAGKTDGPYRGCGGRVKTEGRKREMINQE
jgi:hypothetical protein